MRAYDIDGVICPEPVWLKFLYRVAPQIAVFLRGWLKPQFKPREEYFFVFTDRPRCDSASTMKWLNKHDIVPSGFSFAEKPGDGGKNKAKRINDWKVTEFIESDEEIAEYLRQECPQCEIMVYGGVFALKEECSGK